VEIAAIGGIVFLAALVRATLGFGEALVAMPLLALLLPVRMAAPLVALLAVITGLTVLLREWRHVSLEAAARLTLPAFVAVPMGVYLLRTGDDRLVKGLLAVVILSYTAWSIRRPTGVLLTNDRWAPVAGLVAGFLGGAYNASGPPLVIYGTLRGWPPERFRGMLQSYFTVGGMWVVTTHALGGLLSRDVWQRFVLCIPCVLVASWLGARLSQRLPAERFRLAVHIVLFLIGLMLLASLWPRGSS
jgi:hypothetical protein